MITDFYIIFYWWILILGLTAVFFLAFFFLFEKFWDRGWVFAKIGAIVSISYLVFILGRLKFLPFYQETIFLVIVFFLLVFLLPYRQVKRKKTVLGWLGDNWKVLLGQELLFLLALTFWSFIRGFEPRIEGLEKFMDFGFVNSILRSKFFPPADIWFAGESINYYYFGHFQTAVLTKLSGLNSATTYNLMIATIFGLVFVGSFSLVSNLVFLTKRKIDSHFFRNGLIIGLSAAFLVSLGGNLHSFVYGLAKKGDYWYPDATRFIGYNPNNPNDKTIHEFPSYSFVVADLHGHLNNIPTVLLFLAVLLVFSYQVFKSRSKTLTVKTVGFLALLGFLLGVFYMTNSWDLPIYGIYFAIVLFFGLSLGKKINIKSIIGIAKKEIFYGLIALSAAIVTFLPFALFFEPMTEGIGLVRAHSLWWQLLVLWGFFWFMAVSFWVFVGKKIKRGKTLFASDFFVLSGTILATILIIIPEIIYVKDIYIPEYHRANTMFKLVYQSFIIYGLSSGYIFWRLTGELRKENKAFYFLFSFLFLSGFLAQMTYPFYAIKGYYGELKTKKYQGINAGLEFLKTRYPNDYQAVLWVRKNISGQPVLLEAVGDSYTLYNRMSALTGLPTIEGWLVHEWLWRGGYGRPGARAAEVESIYQGSDENTAVALLKKYKVSYILVGQMEKEKYPNLNEDRIKRWGEEVFSSGETKLYKLN